MAGPTTQQAAPPGDPAATAIRRLQREMLQRATSAANTNELIASLLQLVARHAPLAGASYFSRNEQNELAKTFEIGPKPAGAANERSLKLMKSMAVAACRTGAIEMRRQVNPDRVILAAPVALSNRDPETLCVTFHTNEAEPTFLLLLEMAVSHIVLWRVLAESRSHAADANEASAAVELLDSILSAADADEACYRLTGELQSHLQCGRVALGVRQGNTRTKLVSVSGVANFDSSSTSATAIEAAMDEAVLRDEPTRWPVADSAARHALLAHRNLSQLEEGAAVVSTPLRNEQGEAVAVITLIADPEADGTAAASFLAAVEKPLAAGVAAAIKMEGGWLTKTVRKSYALLSSWKGLAAAIAVGLFALAMLIPAPHRIVCDCQIEPVTRRFVAAPFESALEKSFVKPGDIVKKGELLAMLDGREIRWKRAGLIADRSQAEKKRDAAQVARNYSEQQIAQLEIERLNLEIQLLNHRAENLEVRSPLSGIVVSGDLERAQGVPVTIGQTLFEIAPLESMVVETAIADDDISFIAGKLPLVIQLDAFPSESWQTETALIQPRSEIRDDQNVFIAEAQLANQSGSLRPGMKGRATIYAPWRPLGWVLFHKPWEFLKRKLTM